MSGRKESYADYLRRVADDFEVDGNHATAKDCRKAARRIDTLVNRLSDLTVVFGQLHPMSTLEDYVAAREELERYGK